MYWKMKHGIARVWITALGFWLVVSALACWLYPVMMFDPCARYAPMADAFARGEWYYAFHPRFGVIFQLLSGSVVYVTGLRGVYAIQITAFAFVALAAVVMYRLAKALFDSEEYAWWTFLLSLFAFDFFRFALDGLRDSGKSLVFALLGYGIVSKKGWCFGIGVFIYITLVAYGFAAATVFVGCWCLYWLWEKQPRELVYPLLGWLSGTALQVIMVHAYTGYWVPSPHFIKIMEAFL